MSQPYQRRNDDPLALLPVDESALDTAADAARRSPRRRAIVRFHDHADAVQRMLNAIEPESYARPHRHTAPPRPETFLVLRGSVLVVRFGSSGEPLEGTVASAGGPVYGVEIPGGAWHCFIALRRDTVVYEITQGPYNEVTHKEFASWAPPEESRLAGLDFIAALRRHFEALLPEIAAVDQIEAEDDEIC